MLSGKSPETRYKFYNGSGHNMDVVKAGAVDACGAKTDDLGLFKDYLAEHRFRIKLDDLIGETVRAAIKRMSDAQFPGDEPILKKEDVAPRLKAYEEAIQPLLAYVALLGKWSTADQRPTLSNMMVRLADAFTKLESNSRCAAMRWYPLSLLTYSVGIAAISAENYDSFAASHIKRIYARSRQQRSDYVPVIVPVVVATLELAQMNIWQALPGLERRKAAASEYLFKTLEPQLNALLFLGDSYEHLYDRYEVLRALLYVDQTDDDWAPIGRFGWKHGGAVVASPYTRLRADADQEQDHWGPIAAGLFRGSFERFSQVADKFEKEILSKATHF